MRIRYLPNINKLICYDPDSEIFVCYNIVHQDEKRIEIDQYCDYFENYGRQYWGQGDCDNLTEYDLPYYIETKANNETTSAFYNACFDFVKQSLNKELWIDY